MVGTMCYNSWRSEERPTGPGQYRSTCGGPVAYEGHGVGSRQVRQREPPRGAAERCEPPKRQASDTTGTRGGNSLQVPLSWCILYTYHVQGVNLQKWRLTSQNMSMTLSAKIMTGWRFWSQKAKRQLYKPPLLNGG